MGREGGWEGEGMRVREREEGAADSEELGKVIGKYSNHPTLPTLNGEIYKMNRKQEIF